MSEVQILSPRPCAPLTRPGREHGDEGVVAMAQTVRIFQPPKTAMQSGRAMTDKWVVEFEPTAPREVEPLMGWISGRDTKRQVRLHFDTREEALAYAERNGFTVEL